jgi:glucose/arabinose dehydrogenase
MPRALPLLFALAAAGAELASRTDGKASAVSAAAARPDTVAPTVQLTPLAQIPDVTAITNAGDGRVFITEQRGQITIWDGTQILPTPFLDVSTLIVCCGEQGLLSTAFHPNYAVNGFFFVNYTNLSGQTVVARYRVSDSDPNQADSLSAVILLTIDQPFTNHNGGQLQFGPDGDLYIGMGDGGSENDPLCNSQSTDTLLGKMLRIDVNQNVNQAPYYAVPADNPYVSTTGPPEAWAYGLRNPWKFSFDRTTGDLYIGDVGQDEMEEIDYLPAGSPGGQNYGWKIMEGTLCNSAGPSGCVVTPPPCNDPAYTLPVLTYTHVSGRCAVIGGYVYRGSAIPDLKGSYLYGDYCSGEIWAGSQQNGAWSSVLLSINVPSLTAFGQDGSGEIYVGGQGVFARIDPPPGVSPTIASITPASGPTRGSEGVVIVGTNFTSQTGVLFGGIPARAVVVQSSTVLLVEPPPHPAGLVDVTVVNPGAPPATSTLAYGYIASPRSPRPIPPPRVINR